MRIRPRLSFRPVTQETQGGGNSWRIIPASRLRRRTGESNQSKSNKRRMLVFFFFFFTCPTAQSHPSPTVRLQYMYIVDYLLLTGGLSSFRSFPFPPYEYCTVLYLVYYGIYILIITIIIRPSSATSCRSLFFSSPPPSPHLTLPHLTCVFLPLLLLASLPDEPKTPTRT